MTSSAADPGEWIDNLVRRRPEQVFLRTPEGRELSYAELGERTARFASVYCDATRP